MEHIRRHRDTPCAKHPDTTVHITWTQNDAGKPIVLRGYAIDTNTGVRLDYSDTRKRTARSMHEVMSKHDNLYAAICADIDKHKRKSAVKSSATGADSKSPMLYAFQTLAASTDPVSSDWSPEYEAKNMTHFRRTFLPVLIAHEQTGEEWTDANRDELQKNYVEKILRDKRSMGHEATALETARKTLPAMDTIYQRMRDHDPSLPEISFRPRYTGRHAKNEQLKSLPRRVRRKFKRLLGEYIDKDPRMSMAIIAMYDSGLRTAEAAAIWIDVIIRGEGFATIFVRYQVKHGVRMKLLKTKNAYRFSPMSAWGLAMMDRCLAQLPNDPNDEKMWTCDTRRLSATIRRMLVQAGLTDDYFATAEHAMRERPDYDESGRPIYDVSAYILRRDWASRARSICGYTSLEIDFTLGHEVKIPRKKREDLRHLTAQARLSAKLERYVYDEHHSKHPGITPYAVEHSTDLDLIPYDVIRVRNDSDEPLNVKLDIEAVINVDYIMVVAPQGSQTQATPRYIPTRCTRTTEPIIGKSHVNEDGVLLNEDDDV